MVEEAYQENHNSFGCLWPGLVKMARPCKMENVQTDSESVRDNSYIFALLSSQVGRKPHTWKIEKNLLSSLFKMHLLHYTLRTNGSFHC